MMMRSPVGGAFTHNRVLEFDIEPYKLHIGSYAFDDGRILMLLSEQDDKYFLYHDTEEQRQVILYPIAKKTFYSELGEKLVIDDEGQITLLLLLFPVLRGSSASLSRGPE